MDGNHYIDMSISGIGANILGYADPDVDEAVQTAIKNGNSCSLNCPEEVELADLLCELHPWEEMVRYTRTGGESMAIAIRIARAHTSKDKIAFCGYHGWHDWYLAANLKSVDALDEHLLPGLSPNGVPKGLTGTALPFQYNQLKELEAIVSQNRQDLAAIVMEPIRDEQPRNRDSLKGSGPLQMKLERCWLSTLSGFPDEYQRSPFKSRYHSRYRSILKSLRKWLSYWGHYWNS